MIKVYFTSTKRLTHLTSVVLLLKFRPIKQVNSAWSEIPEQSNQPVPLNVFSVQLVGNRAGFSSDGTAHLAAKVGRKNWGRQSPAAQRGMGTASPGQGGLFCCCAFGRALHEVSLLDTGLLRWDTTHSTPGITAVVGDAHS